jgi:adenylyltransferase/sulfurtransferase
MHLTKDVGRPKLDSAYDRLTGMNPHIEIVRHETALSSANALDLFRDYDIIADGTDNFPTRYLVNDACVLLGKPNVYGSIFRFEGQASVFATQEGPCYRCLYPEPPPPGLVPSCAEGGVLGILPGLVGVIQATEVVKLILGKGNPLIGRLLLVDALEMKFRELKLRKDPNCPICGKNRTIHELIDYEQFCGIHPEPPPAPGVSEWEITPVELKKKMDRKDDFVLLDVREPHEADICIIPGSILIPKGQVPARVSELNSADEFAVYCRSGARSAQVVDFLRHAGFKKVKNVKGGILAWSDQVDPSVPKY